MDELYGEQLEILETYIGGIRLIAEIIKQIEVGEFRVIEEVVIIEGKPEIYRFSCSHFILNTSQSLIILTGEEITNEKKLEQEIRNSELKFRSLVENIPGIVFRLNTTINRFEFFNDQFTKISGYIPQSVSSEDYNPILPLIIPEDQDLRRSVLQSSLTTREPYEVEYRMQHKNGDIIYLLELGQPMYDSQDNPVYVNGIIFDISPIKRLEHSLRESEQNYRILTEYSPDMIFVIGEDDTVLFVNTMAAGFLHLPAERIVGKPRSNFFPPEVGAVQRKHILQVLKSEKPLRYETVIPGKNRKSWQDTHLIPLPDEQGEVYAVLGICRDITMQKEMEQSLRESEEKYRQLIELAQEGIWAIDADGNTTFVNQYMAKILGYTIKEMAGAHLFSFMDDEGKKVAVENLERRRQGITEEHDFEFVRKDGSRMYARLSTSPITDVKGDYAGALAVVADITDRKAAEEALRNNQEYYETLLHMIHDPLHVVDRNHHLVFANKKFQTLTRSAGYQVLIGEDLFTLYPFLPDYVCMEYEKVFTTGAPVITEESTTIHGLLHHTQTTKSPVIQKDGTISHVITIIRDITERRSAEKALCTANKKLNLLSGITRHEIKNKVITLRGYLDLTRPKIDDPTLSWYLTEIEKAATDIQNHIEFTKVYENLGLQKPAWHQISGIIEEIDDSSLTIRNECGDIMVYADPMFENVIHNLYDNTVRHGEGADTLLIRCEKQDDCLVISFEDNGAGVRDELKDRIFMKGFGSNTGFGLFLTREILAITGISIQENGVHGKGARFEMLVPSGAWNERVLNG